MVRLIDFILTAYITHQQCRGFGFLCQTVKDNASGSPLHANLKAFHTLQSMDKDNRGSVNY